MLRLYQRNLRAWPLTVKSCYHAASARLALSHWLLSCLGPLPTMLVLNAKCLIYLNCQEATCYKSRPIQRFKAIKELSMYLLCVC